MWTYIIIIYYLSGEIAKPDMEDFIDCKSAKNYYESVFYNDKSIKSIDCEFWYIDKKTSKL